MITQAGKAPPERLTLMNKPVLPTIAAYFLLLGATTVLLAFYHMHVAGYFGTAQLIPDCSLSIQNQWRLFGALVVADVGIAIGLLRQQRWAKPAFITLVFLWGAVNLLTVKFNTTRFLCDLVFAAIQVGMLAISPTTTWRASKLQRPGWRGIRKVVGLSFYWAAAFVLFVILTSGFLPQEAAASGSVEVHTGAYIALASVVMLAGGNIMGELTVAATEAALILIALASFMVAYLIQIYLVSNMTYPNYPLHFQWDNTFPWLIMLGTVGFVLMAVSERRQAAS